MLEVILSAAFSAVGVASGEKDGTAAVAVLLDVLLDVLVHVRVVVPGGPDDGRSVPVDALLHDLLHRPQTARSEPANAGVRPGVRPALFAGDAFPAELPPPR